MVFGSFLTLKVGEIIFSYFKSDVSGLSNLFHNWFKIFTWLCFLRQNMVTVAQDTRASFFLADIYKKK